MPFHSFGIPGNFAADINGYSRLQGWFEFEPLGNACTPAAR